MNRLQHLPNDLYHTLQKRSLLKVISGLSNFDQASLSRVARAAGQGGADLLDIACDPNLVRIASDLSGLPICVSSVEPELFPKAVEAGAVMVEIGNFDSFYPKGRFFEAAEVLDLTKETRKMLPRTPLSVTVPHFLPLDQQAQLALDLVDVGADLIQTEGGTSAKPLNSGSLGLIEKASPTLAAVHTIAQAFQRTNIRIPVLCASGLSAVTVPMAFSVGASGVGIGSAINRLSDEISMIAVVKRLRESIGSSKQAFDSFIHS